MAPVWSSRPPMLRHAYGYALANKVAPGRIQGWVGHRPITSCGLHGIGSEPVQGLLAVTVE